MIEIAVPGAPAIAGLRFRHYHGEEDLPGMLRVYMAVHELNFGFVDPSWRRRGIGGALHRHNEERLGRFHIGQPGRRHG